MTKSERYSTFGMHEQTDLIELWTIHCTTRNISLIFLHTSENGHFKPAPRTSGALSPSSRGAPLWRCKGTRFATARTPDCADRPSRVRSPNFYFEGSEAERTVTVWEKEKGIIHRSNCEIACVTSRCFCSRMSTSPTSPREPWSISAQIGQFFIEISQNFRIFL